MTHAAPPERRRRVLPGAPGPRQRVSARLLLVLAATAARSGNRRGPAARAATVHGRLLSLRFYTFHL